MALFVIGTDEQGRDLWSRLMYGTRTSLTIGLLGVGMSLVLGVVLGGISGLYGGVVDTVIQRVIEIFAPFHHSSLDGLARRPPRNDWDGDAGLLRHHPHLSLVGWTELARVVRGPLSLAPRGGFRDGGGAGGVLAPRAS